MKKLISGTCTPHDQKKPWFSIMDFLEPPLSGEEFKLGHYQSHMPIEMAKTIKQGEHILFSIDFETLCKEVHWSNVNKRHSVPCGYGQSILDLREIKNGNAKQLSMAKAANVAARSVLDVVLNTDDFTFSPCLDNPGDRGHNWTQRAKTDHFIVDEFSDHYGHDCRGMDWNTTRSYTGAHGKSKFVALENPGQYIRTR
ncbi:hypothetical protein LY78DRAFT_668257 [Colletotrichum sublineola]|nr:hypothetical protein LY78DRAFT_668257 [Colletotrichum sublineola]